MLIEHWWIFGCDWGSQVTTIAEEVRRFLGAKPALSVVQLDDVYAAMNYQNCAAARAALYGHAAGNSVAKRGQPLKYFAIYLQLEYADSQKADVFLSLPGIPRNRILQDVPLNMVVPQIIQRLKEKYGKETIDYWGHAAQRRTVDQARPAMIKAIKRDGVCRLCKVANDLRQLNGFSPLTPEPIRASHIVSRKVMFWTILDEIDREGHNIFGDTGAALIKQRLRNEPLHSNEQFIIALCAHHDRLLLGSLRSATT